MVERLANKSCEPCEGGVPPLPDAERARLLEELGHGWVIKDDHHLDKSFTFGDFKEALAFVNEVGAIAEHEGHHPDLHLAWGKVRALIWTHSIDGLTESDFVLAAKIERAARG